MPNGQRHPVATVTRGVGEYQEWLKKPMQSYLASVAAQPATRTWRTGGAWLTVLSKWPSHTRTMVTIEQITSNIELTIPPIYIACDVDNPLLGTRGAAEFTARKKGSNPTKSKPLTVLRNEYKSCVNSSTNPMHFKSLWKWRTGALALVSMLPLTQAM